MDIDDMIVGSVRRIHTQKGSISLSLGHGRYQNVMGEWGPARPTTITVQEYGRGQMVKNIDDASEHLAVVDAMNGNRF